MDEHLNCMLFVAGRRASATGRVLVGHNEDDAGGTVVRHGYVPAADWPEGTRLPAEPGCAAVAQAPHTLGYYWSEVKSEAGGATSADFFINDCGVLVTSNNCAFSREDAPDLTDGGVGYNLRRIAAERATSARHGLEILIGLVETWGYAPSGRAYTVADRDEAFMIQIVSGRRYVAARVPDDAVAVMPNHYTFHKLSRAEGMLFPDDIVHYAAARGWYTPEAPGSCADFDFARAYQRGDSWRRPANVIRHVRSLEMLLGREWTQEELPFAVRPGRPVGVREMAALLCNHYEGSPDQRSFGPGGGPHDTENCCVCGADTVESVICEFRDKPRETTLWSAEGRPCEQLWLPLHPLIGIPDALEPMTDAAAEMARHLQPCPQDAAYTGRGWQRFRDFGNAVDMVYRVRAPQLSALRSRLLDEAMAELEACRARMAGAPGTEARLAAFSEEWTARILGEMDRFEAELPWIEMRGPERIRLRRGERIGLEFTAPAGVREESLLLGVCRARNHDQYARPVPGSLKVGEAGKYRVRFPTDPLFTYVNAGLHECWLAGESGDGPFVGKLLCEHLSDG